MALISTFNDSLKKITLMLQKNICLDYLCFSLRDGFLKMLIFYSSFLQIIDELANYPAITMDKSKWPLCKVSRLYFKVLLLYFSRCSKRTTEQQRLARRGGKFRSNLVGKIIH